MSLPFSALTDDERVANSAFAFWGSIAKSFPEMTSGDSQISGEDEAALSLWAFGDPGDRPVEGFGRFDLPESITEERMRAAVAAALVVAAEALFGDAKNAPEPSSEVVRQLESLVCTILYYNAQ